MYRLLRGTIRFHQFYWENCTCISGLVPPIPSLFVALIGCLGAGEILKALGPLFGASCAGMGAMLYQSAHPLAREKARTVASPLLAVN